MSSIGITHLSFALIAMAAGAVVIFMPKGDTLHKRIGYVYTGAMLGLNVSSLFIYKVLGYFGPFHVFAFVSLATVAAGLIPVIRKKPEGGWLEMHYEFMNWSVVGLYAAFWSETFTRFFRFEYFWLVVALATALTVLAGAWFIKSNKERILQKVSDKGNFDQEADSLASSQ